MLKSKKLKPNNKNKRRRKKTKLTSTIIFIAIIGFRNPKALFII